jgi:hypothetical protein
MAVRCGTRAALSGSGGVAAYPSAVRGAALLLLLSAAAHGGDLAASLRRADRDAGRRFLSLAQKADADGQRATAAALYARVIELEPGDAAARVKVGFRLVRGGWERAPEQEADVKARADADALRAREFRDKAARLEEERTKEIIRLCVSQGTPEERQAVLAPMLEAMPDRADLHEALGHVRVGEHWVSPELVPAVRMMPLRLQAWRNHAKDPVAVEASGFTLALPGAPAPLAFRRADGCEVASAPDLGNAPAEAVARVRGFLRFVLGEKAEPWTPPPLLFLGAAEYEAMVRALHPNEQEFALYHRFENYEHKDFYAIRVYGEANAAERYAHGAGYLTMYGLVAKGDERAHAWLLEGFGYLVSLELFDAGNLSYASIDESKAKARGAAAPPAARTRDACLAWVAEEMRAGRGYALEEVFAKSLNDLDLCASLEAWSFLRFLFLCDPEAGKRFPAALRDAKGGTQAARTDSALLAAFGKDRAELERLWHLFP